MSYRINEASTEYIDAKLSRARSSTKGPKCYKTKVDITKVNLDVIKEWINQVISEQLPDDDIVIDYIYELLVANENFPDIISIQVQLKDFLGESEAKTFCERLWNLLISAQDDPDGIPLEILNQRRQDYEELERKQQEHKKEQEHKVSKTNYNRSQYNASKRESEDKNLPPADRSSRDRNREDTSNRERESIQRDRSPRNRNEYYDRKYRNFERNNSQYEERKSQDRGSNDYSRDSDPKYSHRSSRHNTEHSNRDSDRYRNPHSSDRDRSRNHERTY